VASKLYSNGNYIRVRSFILSGAPPSTHPLHDAVEDQEVPVEMIAREFGKQVADIVMEVTDDKTLSKDERKRKQIETAPKKSREAKLIKLADKTSNLRAIASSPAADWSVKRRLEYIEWAKNVVAGLAGCRLGLSSNSTRLSQPPSRRSIHRWRVRSRK
jgi:(p)ppGpp synthase/HD superfamily hydrolase